MSRVTLHEAAHSVVAVTLGLPIVDLALPRHPPGGHLSPLLFTLTETPNPLALLAVAHAGATAVHHMLRREEILAGSDRGVAAEAAKRVARERGLSPAVADSFGKALALSVVRYYEAVLHKLARRLARNGDLPAEVIRKELAALPPPPPFAFSVVPANGSGPVQRLTVEVAGYKAP